MIREDAFEKLQITAPEALWAWLGENHMQAESVWLVTFKASDRARYVSREQVLDALVAHGWIDGIRRKVDDARTMQMISPRKQQIWAETYKKRAARLIDEGRMHPAGMASIEVAKASGLWNALAHVDALQVPADLDQALAEHDGKAWFDAAAPSYRRNVLRWLASATKPETRSKRAGIIAAHAAQARKVPNY